MNQASFDTALQVRNYWRSCGRQGLPAGVSIEDAKAAWEKISNHGFSPVDVTVENIQKALNS